MLARRIRRLAEMAGANGCPANVAVAQMLMVAR